MSQTTQSKPGQSKPGQSKPGQGGQGGRGRGPPVYGRGPPGSEASKPRRPRREPEEEVWVPKTILGQKVASGEITSVEEILESGLRIQESGIIKKLLPDLKSEVLMWV